MNGLKAAKGLLRKEIKQRVAGLTESEKQRQSKIVTDKLLSLEKFQGSKKVSVYLHMSDEIQTVAILQHLLKNKECYIPQYIGPKMKMVRLKSWQDYTELPETKWKIKQPADHDVRPDALDTEGLDLIIMPGLGFTTECDRLGRGKGYYDTYLQKCEDMGYKPYTVALAFNEQICHSIPTDSHDKKLDVVLFPDS
ncbi:5-formyltetrahydrofolate cyclo-ligase-like isoform X2 [Mytilus californianus]|nr:5-formyltetrahydrofolate cyclo-ligase-like isoform X2 [Mytilus californianus]XP_052098214.1 5-formyltetrahydrofolate cyclo-ligase-like isoform X2 [Mytilus californianus]XP_052098215.1 5-formyltetrahydrofolate cyclo-ligase-like isoform X2 [Mytilus californianus]